MNSEVPVLNTDGSVVASRRHLIRQLHREARAGMVKVHLYRGTEAYGSEAFYTLSDGTVLHEVDGLAEDDSDYRYIMLVLQDDRRGKRRRAWGLYQPTTAIF